MAEFSRALGQEEVARLLETTQAEEKAQDQLLNEITRSAILPTALSQDVA
jgi:ferritin-like metal-binding protein YciE